MAGSGDRIYPITISIRTRIYLTEFRSSNSYRTWNESFRCRFEPATIRFNLSTTHFGASTIGLLTETYGLASRDFVIAPCWIYMSWRRTRFLCAGLFQSRSGFRRLHGTASWIRHSPQRGLKTWSRRNPVRDLIIQWQCEA